MDYWTLPRLGREYYRVRITTEPQLTSWEISFDKGLTWHAMAWDNDNNLSTILVAGPGFVANQGDTTPFAVVPASVVPYIRAVDNPEVIVRSTPRVDLV